MDACTLIRQAVLSLACLHRAVKAGLSQEERTNLTALCGRCLWHSLQTCVRVRGMGESTFVGELVREQTKHKQGAALQPTIGWQSWGCFVHRTL